MITDTHKSDINQLWKVMPDAVKNCGPVYSHGSLYFWLSTPELRNHCYMKHAHFSL